LVTYADSSTADVELTSEYSQITQGLDLYTNSLGGGGTHITSGLNEARAMLNDRSTRDFAIKVVVLMTDGRHNLGRTPRRTAFHRDVFRGSRSGGHAGDRRCRQWATIPRPVSRGFDHGLF